MHYYFVLRSLAISLCICLTVYSKHPYQLSIAYSYKQLTYSQMQIVSSFPHLRHDHHHVVRAREFLTLLFHSFRSFIAVGSSSGVHPVSEQSWSM